MRSGCRKLVACVVILTAVLSGCAAHAVQPSAGFRKVGYSVQVGAFKNVSNAQRLADALNARSLDAYWFRKDDGFYAVRFGSFESEAGATSAARRLREQAVISAFFVAEPGSVALKSLRPSSAASMSRVPSPAAGSLSAPSGQATSEGMGVTAARTAERFVGIPYRWGGNTVVEGLDCSGFVRAVYSLCGVQIPRTSAEQFRTGREVSRSELAEGDLVFFGKGGTVTHVGLYTGGGKFVHAPRRNEPIQVTPLDDKRYTVKYMGARRFF